MDYSLVLVAAGSGSRSGLEYNKVFFKIDDKTVIEHSISNFLSDQDCQEIIIVINPKEKHIFTDLITSEKIKYVNGGKTRQDSVNNGLQIVREDYVMIHDGARPYVTVDIINRVKTSLKLYDACVVMVNSIDTVKIVKNNIVKSTPDRNTLYNAQTPQAFKTSLIKNAYKTLYDKKLTVTDDCQAVEITSNVDIYVVEGDYKNIKITTVTDLE